MVNYDSYRKKWQERWAELERRCEERRKDAEAHAHKLADLLASAYEINKVVLYGSVLTPGAFREASDIDLAVEGLAKDRFFEAYGLLMRESPYNVELKPIEDLTPLIKARVLEGRTLYES